MTFADKLKALRATAEISQSTLARASGLSLSAIHDYEQGKREPSLRSAVKLARALGVPTDDFSECDEVKGADKPPRAKKAGAAPARPKRKKKRTP